MGCHSGERIAAESTGHEKREPSCRKHDDLKVARTRDSLYRRSIVLVDLQLLYEAFHDMQQEMDVYPIFINSLRLYRNSLVNPCCIRYRARLKFQAALFVDYSDSSILQLLGYFLFPDKLCS